MHVDRLLCWHLPVPPANPSRTSWISPFRHWRGGGAGKQFCSFNIKKVSLILLSFTLKYYFRYLMSEIFWNFWKSSEFLKIKASYLGISCNRQYYKMSPFMLILMGKFVSSRKGEKRKRTGKGKVNLSGKASFLKSCQMWHLNLSLVIAIGQTHASDPIEDIISIHHKSFVTCCFYCGYFYIYFIPHSSILKQIISPPSLMPPCMNPQCLAHR